MIILLSVEDTWESRRKPWKLVEVRHSVANCNKKSTTLKILLELVESRTFES